MAGVAAQGVVEVGERSAEVALLIALVAHQEVIDGVVRFGVGLRRRPRVRAPAALREIPGAEQVVAPRRRAEGGRAVQEGQCLLRLGPRDLRRQGVCHRVGQEQQ
jgi:hypothetical protein